MYITSLRCILCLFLVFLCSNIFTSAACDEDRDLEKFIAAVHDEDLSTVRRILDRRSSLVNTSIARDTRPLDIAIQRTNLELLEILISYGARINGSTSRFTTSSLRTAFRNMLNPVRDVGILRSLCASKDMKPRNIRQMRNVIACLLKSGASPNELDEDHCSFLFRAVTLRDAELVYLLLRNGAHTIPLQYTAALYKSNPPFFWGTIHHPILHLLMDHGGEDTYEEHETPLFLNETLLSLSVGEENDYNAALKLLQHGSQPHKPCRNNQKRSPLHRAALRRDASYTTLLLSYGVTNLQEQDPNGSTPLTLSRGDTYTVLGVVLPALKNGNLSRALNYTDHVAAACIALGQGYGEVAQHIYNQAATHQQLDILLHAHVLFNLCSSNACSRVLDHISSHVYKFVNDNTTDTVIPGLLYQMADELHRGNIIISHVRKIYNRYASYVDHRLSKKFVSDLAQRMRSTEITMGEMEFFTDTFGRTMSEFRDTAQRRLTYYCNTYVGAYLPASTFNRFTTGDTLLHCIALAPLWVSTYAPMIAYHTINYGGSPRNYAGKTPLQLAYQNDNVAVSRMLEQWRLLADCDSLCQRRGTRSQAVQRLLYAMAAHGLQNPSDIDVQHRDEKAGTRQALPIGVRRHIIEFAHDETDYIGNVSSVN